MTGNDNRASPKRYGLLKGQIQVADDFDSPLELAEFGVSDTAEVAVNNPVESSRLTPDDRAQVEREIEKVVRFATELNGDEARSRKWLDIPLKDLGGQTARQLIEAGHAQGVRDYIESVSSGSVG